MPGNFSLLRTALFETEIRLEETSKCIEMAVWGGRKQTEIGDCRSKGGDTNSDFQCIAWIWCAGSYKWNINENEQLKEPCKGEAWRGSTVSKESWVLACKMNLQGKQQWNLWEEEKNAVEKKLGYHLPVIANAEGHRKLNWRRCLKIYEVVLRIDLVK